MGKVMGCHFHNNITKIVTPVLLADSLFGWLWEPLCFRDSIARVWYDLFLRFLPPTLACQLLEQQGNASSSFVFPAKSLFSFVQGTQ